MGSVVLVSFSRNYSGQIWNSSQSQIRNHIIPGGNGLINRVFTPDKQPPALGTAIAEPPIVGHKAAPKSMSTLEGNISALLPVRSKTSGESFLSRFLGLLSRVRFGIVLLCLLALACLVGMLVMQQNVDGFENYYAALTPAQRLVYSKLGFFNIYHVWYFNGLLALLSLNIVLASVDRFPKTWVFVSRPQVTVPLRWLKDQKQSAEFEVKEEAE